MDSEDLDIHSQLKKELETKKSILLARQDTYNKMRKELVKTEDLIVEANEDLRKTIDELEAYQRSKVISVVDEDLRDAEIDRFKGVLPELMKRLEHETLIVIKQPTMLEQDNEDEENEPEEELAE